MECLDSSDRDNRPAYLLIRVGDVEIVARLLCWVAWMTVSNLIKPRDRGSLRTWGAWEVFASRVGGDGGFVRGGGHCPAFHRFINRSVPRSGSQFYLVIVE